MPKEVWHYARAVCTWVVDGDTILAAVDLGFRTHIVGESFRLDGIDTPETRGKTREAGLLAKNFLKAMIEGKTVELTTVGREKYGRYLARVSLAGKDVATALIDAGHGRPYSGGKR